MRWDVPGKDKECDSTALAASSRNNGSDDGGSIEHKKRACI